MKHPWFRLVIVDLMAIVSDSGAVTAGLLEAALRGEGFDATTDEIRSVLGLPLPRAIAALLRTGGDLEQDADRAARVQAKWTATLYATYARRGAVEELEGASHVLGALRAQGVGIAVATVMPGVVADLLASRLDLFDRGLVDTRVSADEVQDARPRPGMVVEVMKRMVTPDARRVVKVGDTPADLAEGTLAGCGAVVGLTTGMHGRDELALRPHTHIVSRLSALLDVMAVVDVARGPSASQAR